MGAVVPQTPVAPCQHQIIHQRITNLVEQRPPFQAQLLNWRVY